MDDSPILRLSLHCYLFLWKTFHTKHDKEYQEKDRQDQVLLSRVKFREEAYIMENIFIVGFFADI